MSELLQELQQQYQAIQHELPGHGIAWLQDLRKTRLHDLSNQGLPTRKTETWKYVDLSGFQKQSWPLAQAHKLESIDLPLLPLDDAYTLVFVNGRLAEQLSTLDQLAVDHGISTVAKQLDANNDNLHTKLGQRIAYQDHLFASWNHSFMTDGLYLSIPAGTLVNKLIYVVHLHTEANTSSYPYHFIQLGENSEATVIEQYLGHTDHAYFTNIITDIELKQAACLQHYRLQEEAKQAYHIAGVHIQQAQDSVYKSYQFSTGAQLSRLDIQANLIGKGAECLLHGLYQATQQQTMDHHITLEHRVPGTHSYTNYRGTADDKAKAIFNGRIFVEKDAQKTHADLINKNLLLSKTAEINTKPELEIYADDVKCSHGATIGQLDEEALFYLRSRGIEQHEARELLLQAFAQVIIDEVNLDAISTYLLSTQEAT